MRRTDSFALLTAVALLVTGCGSEDRTVAGVDVAATCSDLEDANTPLARRVVESDVLDAVDAYEGSVDDADESILDVIEDLTEQCPDQAARLLGTDVDAGEPLEVSVELGTCAKRDTNGTATNESDRPVNVTIEVQYFDSDDVLLDTTSASVRNLAPGQTGRWDTSYFGDDSPVRCSARLENVRAS